MCVYFISHAGEPFLLFVFFTALWCFISSASEQAGGSSCCYLLCVCAHALLGVTYSVTRCKKKMCRDMCVCVCALRECRTFCRTASALSPSAEKKHSVFGVSTGDGFFTSRRSIMQADSDLQFGLWKIMEHGQLFVWSIYLCSWISVINFQMELNQLGWIQIVIISL